MVKNLIFNLIVLFLVFSGNPLKAKTYEHLFSELVCALKDSKTIRIMDKDYTVLNELPKVKLPSYEKGIADITGNPCYRSRQGPHIISCSELEELPIDLTFFYLHKEIIDATECYLFLMFTADEEWIWKASRTIYWDEKHFPGSLKPFRTVNFLLQKK